jgi:UDP:flavonoid glycosyltransferase YjiC (YdhE family)
VIVYHGGIGFAQQALALGRPQLLVPEHLEQLLNAQLVDRLGVGLFLLGDHDQSENSVARALKTLMTDPHLTRQAQTRAEIVRANGPWNSLALIVERCRTLSRMEPPPLNSL